jgi:hypothetical protein
VATEQREIAVSERNRAEDTARLVTAETLADSDPTSAALLLRELHNPLGRGLAAVSVFRRVAEKPIASALMRGHTGNIFTSAFSPDNQGIVTASDDGTARVWRADGLGAPVVLSGHEGKLFFAAFSADGRFVVTCSDDRTARVWPADGGTPMSFTEDVGRRFEAYGWHVQLNMPVEQIVGHADTLRRLPVQMVFDHMGKVPGIEDPAFDVMRGHIDERKAWVKISGAYFITNVGPPTYADATAVAMAFLKTAPERCLWGSNWPHPWPKDPPDDAEVFDLLSTWAPDAATRNRILVANPEALYGFPKSA